MSGEYLNYIIIENGQYKESEMIGKYLDIARELKKE